MARPIWTGTLSFGLLNVPVSLMSGERSVDLHFRMLDSRSNTPVRYERVNAETGEEVPWKEIVKAFEYAKGSYVVLEPEDIKSAAADGREVVDVKAFVEAGSIGPEYFEKPYFLVPGKKAEKGYVLLREVLKRTGRIGIARVVIRTREYLSAVMPRGNALVLMLLRYPQELVDAEDYRIPEGAASEYRISPKEIQMAEQLIESMSDEWNPAEYRDEFRDRLRKVIEQRMKSKGVVTTESEDEADMPENATTNVVDFMSLLQKSLASNKRTPARKTAAKSAGKAARGKGTDKPADKSTAGKKSTAKKAAAKKRAATRKAG
ncbi:Ku protein [Rhodanobacter spathiphylli]|uniref:Non-homologous end joining protein Ku n=1 Tax=Rhodanobacter spathiphylli B39 TaxID=1163407 RepID=I4W174_9GAMM|nr:Ku protein [Rhodanobacter spathiphylli]EIL93215.1 DNA repair protein [Rhodanobacter spathiphylli B39]